MIRILPQKTLCLHRGPRSSRPCGSAEEERTRQEGERLVNTICKQLWHLRYRAT